MNSIHLYALFIITLLCSCSTRDYYITSPNGNIKLDFSVTENGVPYYSIVYRNDTIVKPSTLGIRFEENQMDTLVSLENVEIAENIIQYDLLANQYFSHDCEYSTISALISKNGQKLKIIMRVYNDGVAIRYFAQGFENVVIGGNMTEVNFDLKTNSVSSFGYNDKNIIEHSEIKDTENTDSDVFKHEDSTLVGNTYLKAPLILNKNNQTFMSLHILSFEQDREFWLQKTRKNSSLQILVMSKDRNGRVITLPAFSPWTILSISDTPEKLLESSLDYNLRIEEENPTLRREYPLDIYKDVAYENILTLSKIKRSTMSHDLALSVIFNNHVEMYDGTDEIFNLYPTIILRKNAKFAQEFVNSIPKHWGEMRVLDTELDKYLIVARKDIDSYTWVVGGVTDSKQRNGSISLDFLEEDKLYEATINSDDINSNQELDPDAIKIKKRRVNHTDSIKYNMLPNGGFTVTLREIVAD